MQNNPAVTYDLLKRLYSGVDGLLEKLATSLAFPADQRLMNELVIYGKRFGKENADHTTTLTVTMEQLSHLTGLARETISRELQKLKKKGIVKLRRGSIIVYGLPFIAPYGMHCSRSTLRSRYSRQQR